MTKILDPYYVTAPYTYFCVGSANVYSSYGCYGSGGDYIANLSQFQITNYCRDEYTSVYCNFDGGGTGYTEANPYHTDDLTDAGVNALARPDCTQFQSDKRVRMWCNGSIPAPSSARHAKLQAAINKIKAIPDEYCMSIGAEAQRLLDSGYVRVYPKDSLVGIGGFAPSFKMGTDDAYIAISDQWTDLAYDDNHVKRVFGNKINLQLILSHELSHLWGISAAGHLSTTTVGKLFTSMTSRCSGQGEPINTQL